HEHGRITEILFEGGTHALRHVPVEATKYGEQFVHDEGLLFREPLIILKEVQAKGAFQVSGIEVDNVFVALRRNIREDVENVVTVRVNKADTVPGGDILRDKRLHKRRLTRAGLSNHIEVPQAVGRPETHLGLLPAVGISTE